MPVLLPRDSLSDPCSLPVLRILFSFSFDVIMDNLLLCEIRSGYRDITMGQGVSIQYLYSAVFCKKQKHQRSDDTSSPSTAMYLFLLTSYIMYMD